jgi:transcriptional regulator with XRE-family HTH domain
MKQKRPSDLHRKPTTLGGVLRQHREEAGLTITEMAARLEVSAPHLSRLERDGITRPSMELLLRITRYSGISSEDLYALTGVLLPADLPDFIPYLRAKHPDWPDSVVTELDDFRDFLKTRYSLH